MIYTCHTVDQDMDSAALQIFIGIDFSAEIVAEGLGV